MRELLDLIRWAVVVSGCIHLVTASAIFSSVRTLLARGSRFRTGLLYCGACTGFWVGIAVGACRVWPLSTGAVAIVESALGALALGAVWQKFVSDSEAFQAELPNLDLELHDDEASEKAHE